MASPPLLHALDHIMFFCFPITIATRLPAASDICETRTQMDAIKKEKETDYTFSQNEILSSRSSSIIQNYTCISVFSRPHYGQLVFLLLYFSSGLCLIPLCQSRAGFKPATTAVTHFTASTPPSAPDTTPLNDPQ